MPRDIVWSIGSRDVLLCLTWSRIERLRAEYGDAWDTDLVEMVEKRQLEKVAPALVIMSGGALSKEEIFAASPPVIQTQEAIMRCVMRAFYGTDEPINATIEDADPKQKARRTWWRRLAGRLFDAASHPRLSQI